MSRESVSDRSCTKPRKLWEFDSSCLNFKIISIHCSPSCCHLAPQHSAAVRKRWEWLQGVSGLNLVLFLPVAASFHSHQCVKHVLWSGAAFISLNQTVLLCKWWAHAGEHSQAFPNRLFPTPMPSVTLPRRVCETYLRLLAGYAALWSCLFPSSCAHFLAQCGRRALCLHACVLLWSVCAGLAVPSPGGLWGQWRTQTCLIRSSDTWAQQD